MEDVGGDSEDQPLRPHEALNQALNPGPNPPAASAATRPQTGLGPGPLGRLLVGFAQSSRVTV